MSEKKRSRGPAPAPSSDKYGFLEGMIRIRQEALGREILAAVEVAKWRERPSDDPHRARTWEGTAPGGFHFVVVDFEIESQGFKEQRGADGMVSVPGSAVRLGHKLAAHAVELARRQAGIT